MKRLLASTALIALGAAPVAAQQSDSELFMSPDAGGAEVMASTLIGKRIYTTETEVEDSGDVTEASTDWEDIGEVNDIIVAKDGSINGVLLDIGGFLGVGEHTVAVNMNEIQLVNDADADGEYFLVVNSTREALENAPEFDIANVGSWAAANVEAAGAEMENAADDAAVTAENTAESVEESTEEALQSAETSIDNAAENTEQAAENAAAETGEAAEELEQSAENTANDAADAMNAAGEETAEAVEETGDAMEQTAETGLAPKVEQEGWSTANFDQMTADELTGARIFDTNDEMIGEISKLLMDDSGQVNQAVLDVGGFLGLGEHSVAMEMEKLQITTEDETGNIKVYVDSTKEQLEAMPEYAEEG